MRTFTKFSLGIRANGSCEETFNFILQFMQLFSSNPTSQWPWKSALAWPLHKFPGKGIEPKIPGLWWIINPGGHRQLGLMNSWVPRIRMSVSRSLLFSCLLHSAHSPAWLANPALLYYHHVPPGFVKWCFNLVKNRVFWQGSRADHQDPDRPSLKLGELGMFSDRQNTSTLPVWVKQTAERLEWQPQAVKTSKKPLQP